MKPWLLVTLGLALRLGFMFYGEWQDHNLEVKYTDIDYVVYTEAARHLVEEGNPYVKPTFRYTPILAYLMTPNLWLHPAFGKLLFVVADVVQGWLLLKVLLLRGVNPRMATFSAALHMFNVIAVNVSSRGNADSIISALVLGALYLLLKKRVLWAGLVYGVSVHMKIYPIVYSLPMFLCLDENFTGKPARSIWSKIVNKSRVTLVLASAASFLLLTSLCYWKFGYNFLYNAYIYHLGRTDPKHNFSPYFLALYLSRGNPTWASLSKLAFLPQLLLEFVVGVRWYRDLPFCMLLQTIVFVAFNKVCTVQYFVWYLSLLPLAIPYTNMSLKKGLFLGAAWFIGQGAWLGSAYLLEFQGWNAFIPVWVASLIFLVINVAVIVALARNHTFVPVFSQILRNKTQ